MICPCVAAWPNQLLTRRPPGAEPEDSRSRYGSGAWLPAYENIFGAGTKVRRARTVARILEDRAQLPDEGLGEFTKDVWQIVQDAIDHTCRAAGTAAVETTA